MSDDESEEDSDDYVSPMPGFTSYSEVIKALENVSHFLEYQGHTGEVTEVMTLVSTVTQLHYRNLSTRSRQATLSEFFPGVPAV